MRKLLQGVSVAYGIMLFILLVLGAYTTIPWITIAYVAAVILYAYKVISGGYIIMAFSILIGLFWLSQITGVLDLFDIGFATMTAIITAKLEKKS